MTTRQLVPCATINDWMTRALQGALGSDACQLNLSYRLREPDADGCNWSTANLRCGSDSGAHDPNLQRAKLITPEIIERARQLFNLTDAPETIEPEEKPIMCMLLERRLLYIPTFHIDTNLINAKQKLEEVNRLERWAKDGVILINMSSTAHAEATAGGDPRRTRKAAEQIFTINADNTDARLLNDVGAALFPNGPQNENQWNDVRIVCDAAKYHATLVTNDGESKSQPGGILGNREKCQNIAGIKILSPQEAVVFVESKINERDDFNRCIAQETGKKLPNWIGKN